MRLPENNTQNEWHYIFNFFISKTWPYNTISNIKLEGIYRMIAIKERIQIKPIISI